LKKTFKIQGENKNPDRAVEAIKNEVRKYIKREQRKPLPKEKDFWLFDCKFAKENEEPKVIEFVDITKSIDEAHSENCASFYLEILSRAEKRKPKEIVELEDDNENENESEEAEVN